MGRAYHILIFWAAICGNIIVFLFLAWLNIRRKERKALRKIVSKTIDWTEMTGEHSIFEVDEFGPIPPTERKDSD